MTFTEAEIGRMVNARTAYPELALGVTHDARTPLSGIRHQNPHGTTLREAAISYALQETRIQQ